MAGKTPEQIRHGHHAEAYQTIAIRTFIAAVVLSALGVTAIPSINEFIQTSSPEIGKFLPQWLGIAAAGGALTMYATAAITAGVAETEAKHK